MKITTRAWPGSGRQHPPLYDVLIDGFPIGTDDPAATSDGRVLQMGTRYLAIYDPAPFGAGGSYATRKDAAAAVATRHAERIARRYARVLAAASETGDRAIVVYHDVTTTRAKTFSTVLAADVFIRSLRDIAPHADAITVYRRDHDGTYSPVQRP